MKKIVMGKKKGCVSVDKIDNSSIIGTDGPNGKGFIALVYSWDKDRYAEILFCIGGNVPNLIAHPEKQKRSVCGAVNHVIKQGKKAYLFDSKRELFEWGLEGLED